VVGFGHLLCTLLKQFGHVKVICRQLVSTKAKWYETQSMFTKLRRMSHYVRKLELAYRSLRSPYFRWVDPGHFYSPFPDMAEMERRTNYIYPPMPAELAGINLNRSAQE
jgi:hypothetical protein